MLNPLQKKELADFNLLSNTIRDIEHDLIQIANGNLSKTKAWIRISKIHLCQESNPNVFLFFFNLLFPKWETEPWLYPTTHPTTSDLKTANIIKLMKYANVNSVQALHRWCKAHYSDFLEFFRKTFNLTFKQIPDCNCDLSNSEYPNWFPNGRMNIVDTCFNAAPEKTALIYLDTQQKIATYSYGELNILVNRIAVSLSKLAIKAGDVIGIIMSFSPFAIGIYLAIIKMGAVVASIPDSFSSEEIAKRLEITNAKLIFTEDELQWDNKKILLYEKLIVNIHTPMIVLKQTQQSLKRDIDIDFNYFLVTDSFFESISVSPMTPCQILFSSGTTGIPKAIIWEQATAIKAASDGYLYQDIKEEDILLWPTNLGWMMGPWQIFAVFFNQATLAIYKDTPKSRKFGEYVAAAKVSILGIVPTLVHFWRQTNCMQELNWHHIRLFTSTGECSNALDMFYLMALAGMKPVIEYCGGTEIGGAYLSSTIIEKNYPTVFTTPVMGTTIHILDENGQESDLGELAIEPPALGLSSQLLNANHHKIYYENMPIMKNYLLRRHGDYVERLKLDGYILLGRTDDTMNLNGIKVSSAEIERAIQDKNIIESAAIAVNHQGPTFLILYVVLKNNNEEKPALQKKLQNAINKNLNPLFKIHDIVIVDELPKTPSNKIMRRLLREKYQKFLFS